MSQIEKSETVCWECKYSIYDPFWGDYKCNVWQISILRPVAGCALWEKRSANEEQAISKECKKEKNA